MSYKVINFNKRGDDQGWLVAIENSSDIPFDTKRVFYIFDTKGDIVRGAHANQNSQFLLVCVKGTCDVKIRHPQKDDKIICLDTPNKGLWLDKMVWKEMYNFSDDSVLLVLSDHAYDPEEYIHSYSDFSKSIS